MNKGTTKKLVGRPIFKQVIKILSKSYIAVSAVPPIPTTNKGLLPDKPQRVFHNHKSLEPKFSLNYFPEKIYNKSALYLVYIYTIPCILMN